MDDAALFADPGYSTSRVPVIRQKEAKYERADATRVVVRHLLGYEPFLAMCVALKSDPREVASSIASFGDFVRDHGQDLRARGLIDAAATFLGNMLVAFRDDAFWVRYGDEFPSAGNERQQYEVLHLLDLLIDSDGTTYRTCRGMVEEWALS